MHNIEAKLYGPNWGSILFVIAFEAVCVLGIFPISLGMSVVYGEEVSDQWMDRTFARLDAYASDL